jgi:hypothetical protein
MGKKKEEGRRRRRRRMGKKKKGKKKNGEEGDEEEEEGRGEEEEEEKMRSSHFGTFERLHHVHHRRHAKETCLAWKMSSCVFLLYLLFYFICFPRNVPNCRIAVRTLATKLFSIELTRLVMFGLRRRGTRR